MKRIYVFICLFCCSCSSCLFGRFDLECKVQITNEYVFFDHCYNGLMIHELEVMNGDIDLYPHEYKRVNQYELLANDSTLHQKRNIKAFFSTKNKMFAWKIYHCDNYDPLKCFSDGDNYEIKDTIHLFKQNTWYQFNFYNPHFEAFVFCDSNGKVSFVKRDLNANF